MIKWIIFSLLTSALYRIGGKGGFKNAKAIRRFGCPLLCYGYLWWLGLGSWQQGTFWWQQGTFWWQNWLVLGVLAYGVTIPAISSYWDSIFGYDNFYAHGFGIGLGAIPLFWLGVHWYMILARIIILTVFMGLWSKYWNWDVGEELGRGFSITATIPLLLL